MPNIKQLLGEDMWEPNPNAVVATKCMPWRSPGASTENAGNWNLGLARIYSTLDMGISWSKPNHLSKLSTPKPHTLNKP